MERRNESKHVTNNLQSSDACNRPKVVLINPNFQHKQRSVNKTIYVNPLFKRTNVQSNYAALSSLPVSIIPSSNLTNTAEANYLHTNSSNSVPSSSASWEQTKICGSYNVQENSKEASGASTPLSSQCFNSNDSIQSTTSRNPFMLVNPRHYLAKAYSQPRKTFVNPKFLQIHGAPTGQKIVHSEGVHSNVIKHSSVSDNVPLERDKYSSSFVKVNRQADRGNKVTNSSIILDGGTLNEPKVQATTSFSTSLNSDAMKEEISTKNCPTQAKSPLPNFSPFLERSAQKKKLNLLKLQKITRLAQLARITALKKKSPKPSTPLRSNFQNSFTRASNLSFKLSSKSRRRSKSQEEQKLFKSCSKYKFVRLVSNNSAATKQAVSDSQSKVLKNCNATNLNLSKRSNPQLSRYKNYAPLSNSKINQANANKSCKEANQNVEIVSGFSSLPESNVEINFKANENVCDSKGDPNARKFFYVSRRKLVRKSSARKMVYQKKLRYLVKNSNIIKNINFKQSKTLAANFKINFKPSRTSADVINKRIMQRKVINRYKVMNVQRSQVDDKSCPVTSTSIKSQITRNEKYVLERKGRKSFNQPKSKNSSFVTIGKTKLIRKSLLHQKLLGKTMNNLKKRNHSKHFKSSLTSLQRRLASQKPQMKILGSRRNLKIVNCDLIAFGKTKLIKKSLLHQREQMAELRKAQNSTGASSVIRKQLKSCHKTLYNLSQNSKYPLKKQFFKLKFKALNAVKKKLLKKRMIAARCKNNIPCEIFHRYGRCKKFVVGKCFKLHDKKFVAICQNQTVVNTQRHLLANLELHRFIRGECKSESCLLSHEINPHKMPTCHHFLQGACSRDNCLYPHVKLNAKAPICREFVRGFCPAGLDCNKLHVIICPESEKNGTCSNRANCKFVHRKKKAPGKKDPKSSVKSKTESAGPSCQGSETADAISNLSEISSDSTKRYFVSGSGEELESIIPSRPKLSALPSFIPLSSCDSLSQLPS